MDELWLGGGVATALVGAIVGAAKVVVSRHLKSYDQLEEQIKAIREQQADHELEDEKRHARVRKDIERAGRRTRHNLRNAVNANQQFMFLEVENSRNEILDHIDRLVDPEKRREPRRKSTKPPMITSDDPEEDEDSQDLIDRTDS